jgi:hypothetical protein
MTGEQRYTMADHEQYRREVEAQAEREAQERREATREAAKKAWVADGGSTSSFERAWDRLEEDRRKERLQAAADAARAHQRQYSGI